MKGGPGHGEHFDHTSGRPRGDGGAGNGDGQGMVVCREPSAVAPSRPGLPLPVIRLVTREHQPANDGVIGSVTFAGKNVNSRR